MMGGGKWRDFELAKDVDRLSYGKKGIFFVQNIKNIDEIHFIEAKVKLY